MSELHGKDFDLAALNESGIGPCMGLSLKVTILSIGHHRTHRDLLDVLILPECQWRKLLPIFGMSASFMVGM
jgi:hypothetical protein